MSPRPRKYTDDEVFAAAYRVMGRLSPDALTLADIAAEAGLTPGALLARYGSKRELLLTLVTRLTEATPAMLDGLRAAHRSPLAAVRAYGADFAAMVDSPASLAHHLGWLQLDFGDPDFLRQLRAQARATHAALVRWIAEAVAARELRAATDIDELARTVYTMVSGAVMTWPLFREGSPAEWMTRRLDAVLGVHLRTSRPARTRHDRSASRG